VAAREQARDRELYRLGFTDDDFANLLGESGDSFRYVETNCRIAQSGKHGRAQKEALG
jgi:hypothetical protein